MSVQQDSHQLGFVLLLNDPIAEHLFHNAVNHLSQVLSLKIQNDNTCVPEKNVEEVRRTILTLPISILTCLKDQSEVDERVERERGYVSLSPPLCTLLPVLLVLDPPGVLHPLLALQLVHLHEQVVRAVVVPLFHQQQIHELQQSKKHAITWMKNQWLGGTSAACFDKLTSWF